MSAPHILYRFYDAEDALLYIGITNNPRVRYGRHRSDKRWFRHVTRSTMTHYSSRAELEAEEIQAIQAEKPRYNIAHSVAPTPNRIAVKPRTIFAPTDANSFPRPDRIAGDDPTADEIERRLDQLEVQFHQRPVLIPLRRCQSCQLICLTREYDGLVRCLNCQNMWAPEEMVSDLEVLKQRIEELQ